MNLSIVFLLVYLTLITWKQAVALQPVNISAHNSLQETSNGDSIDSIVQQVPVPPDNFDAVNSPSEGEKFLETKKNPKDFILDYIERKGDQILLLSPELQAIIASLVKLWEESPKDKREYIHNMVRNYTAFPLKVGADLGIILDTVTQDVKWLANRLNSIVFLISCLVFIGFLGLVTLVAELFSIFSFLTKWFRRGTIWTAVFVMVLSFALNLIASFFPQ